MIQTEGAWARRGQIKEHKTINDGQFAVIVDGPPCLARMHHEVSDRHFPGKNERRGPGEKAQQEEQPANQLQNARNAGR